MMEDETDDEADEPVEKLERSETFKEQTKEQTKEIHEPQTSQTQQTQKPTQSLRVDSQKIDLLIDTISEMVTLNIKMAQHVEQTQDTQLEDLSLELGSLLQTLRNNVM